MGPVLPTLSEFQGLDFGRLLEKPEEEENELLRPMQDRALARISIFKPITPEERLEAFSRLGFHPHGIFMPSDWELREKMTRALRVIGDIPNERIDERLAKYYEFQAWTGTLEGKISGEWTGQMAVARSRARFRLVAWGRRGGKTLLAAHEALGVAIMRPRSWVWLAAPIMGLVDRGFEMILRLIDDLGLETLMRRNTTQVKVVILKNGAKIEGISLENIMSAAGAAVDFAVVDEAAQVGADAWERAIMPPLADRNGQALLISSYEGEGDFFHTKALAAKAEHEKYGTGSDWETFQGATYDVNFFVAPQGINTPSIIQARREMDPQNFLEQFGAVPAGAKERVYPEFKERVHVGNYPFNPDHPVILAVDPSGGSNPYAIIPVQDYGDRLYVVDEIYESHATFEELDPVIRSRPWAANVTDVVMDSALPAEIERWVQAGWPAFAVFEKPRVEERLPLMRRWLREPARYYLFWRQRINFFLRKEGRKDDSDGDLTPEELRALMTYVEESLNNEKMVDEDMQRLRGCARIFFNQACTNTIFEIKSYKYHRRRAFNSNFREDPVKANDHAMDAISYMLWHYHRFEITGEDEGSNFVRRVSPGLLPRYAPPEQDDEARAQASRVQHRTGWLSSLRDAYGPENRRDSYSSLQVV